jgi:hypothetical protein
MAVSYERAQNYPEALNDIKLSKNAYHLVIIF